MQCSYEWLCGSRTENVICVLLSYNLCEIYSNTGSGRKFVDKTLRQLRRQQARNHDVSMVVYAGDPNINF